jgi:endonuclease YncB( thermonuclease family)
MRDSPPYLPFVAITCALLTFASPGVAQAQTVTSPSSTAATTTASPAGPSTATSATTAADAPVQTTVDGEKVTCRTVTVTGSRLQRRRVCSSASTEQGASDWTREQQTKGGMAASANIPGG